MAKKRKRHHKGRRRMAGAGGGKKMNTLLTIGSAVAGYFMSDTINTQVLKVLPQTTTGTGTSATTGGNQTMGIVVEGGVGAALVLAVKARGTMGKVAKVAGGLLLGVAAKQIAKKTGIVSGYQAVPVLGKRRMAGYQAVPVLGGNTPAQLQGKIPAQLQGYRVNGMGGYVNNGSGVMGAIGQPCGSGSGITYNNSEHLG